MSYDDRKLRSPDDEIDLGVMPTPHCPFCRVLVFVPGQHRSAQLDHYRAELNQLSRLNPTTENQQ